MSVYWLFDDSVQPAWAVQMENRINQQLGMIMALVSVEQSELDNLDTALDEATTAIADRIQALVDAGTLPAADVTALQQDVENLRSLAAPTPAPPAADEPPVA